MFAYTFHFICLAVFKPLLKSQLLKLMWISFNSAYNFS
jgi:hypothetical protein